MCIRDRHIAPESYAEVGRYIFPTFKRTLVFLKEKGYAFVMEKENLKQYDYSVTVSYTHLDVYKRQVNTCTNT